VWLVLLPAAVQKEKEEALHGPANSWELFKDRLEDDLLVLENPKAQHPGPEEQPIKIGAVVQQHDGPLIVHDLVPGANDFHTIDKF